MELRDYALLIIWSCIVFGVGAAAGVAVLGDVWLRMT